jgi:hypothetical protein
MACRQRNAVSGIFPVKPAPVECVPPLQLKENEKRKGGVARVRAFKHKITMEKGTAVASPRIWQLLLPCQHGLPDVLRCAILAYRLKCAAK